jgi:sugar/nucleoside kinase (ribokinase family)
LLHLFRIMKILIAGEMNPDLVLRNASAFPEPGKEVLVDDLLMTVGGSSANCAVGLARLGNQVTFATKIGQDVWGDFCLESMKAEGVDTSLMIRDPALKTGITVAVTSIKERAFITYLGSIAALQPEDVPEAQFGSFRHFHVGGYYLQEALRRGLKKLFVAAHRQGLTTSLDCGYDPSEKWGAEILDTLAEVDVFLPNESEVCAISRRRDPIEGLRALSGGRTLVVAKLGPDGCAALEGSQLRFVPSFQVRVVDTTGAGDSFDAGFLHAWLNRRPLVECLRFGTACGALSTRGMGGTTTQPTAHEVEELLNANTLK